MEKLGRFLKFVMYHHNFFVKESQSYMIGVDRIKYYIGYPMVYFTFMKLSLINFK